MNVSIFVIVIGSLFWETYIALRNTKCHTLNIVMETLIACIFKEIRNVLSWQVNCFWMWRAWCDKNMTHRYLVTKMPRLCIRKESCYDLAEWINECTVKWTRIVAGNNDTVQVLSVWLSVWIFPNTLFILRSECFIMPASLSYWL